MPSHGLLEVPQAGLSQKGRTIHPSLLRPFKVPAFVRQDATLLEEASHDQAKDSQRDLNQKEGHHVDVHK